MSPSAPLVDDIHDRSEDFSTQLMDLASAELENLRSRSDMKRSYRSFPPACLSMLKTIEGNKKCMDCGGNDPQWATVGYGALVCLQCSGRHRSFGVHNTRVLSLTMDEWTLEEIVSMLEGGNFQLGNFFARHALTRDTCSSESNNSKVISKDNVVWLRYKTKAAQFYRQQMKLHAHSVIESGPYRGREMSRRKRHPSAYRRNSE